MKTKKKKINARKEQEKKKKREVMSGQEGVKRSVFEGGGEAEKTEKIEKADKVEEKDMGGGANGRGIGVGGKKEEANLIEEKQGSEENEEEEEKEQLSEKEILIKEFLDSLNCDNLAEKIACVQKMRILCEKIGPEYTRNNLLPLLLQNMGLYCEVMEEIGAQVIESFEYMGTKDDYPQTFFSFLNRLVAKREAEVKEKGVILYDHMISESTDEFFMKKIKLETLKLAKHRGEEYRIGGAAIILSALRKVIEMRNAEIAQHFIAVFCELLKDKALLVKRAAVKALPTYYSLLKKISDTNLFPVDALVSQAFELLCEFSHEEQIPEPVRIMTCYALETFLSLFTFFNFDKTVQMIQALSSDTAWRVRCASADLLEKIFLQKTSAELFEKKCLPIFLNLLKDRDANVKSVSLSKLGKIIKQCENPSVALSMIGIDFLEKECESASSPHVKLSMMLMLSDLSGFLDEKYTTGFLLPVFQTLLRDEDSAMKVKALAICPKISAAIGTQNFQTNLLPMLVSLRESENWRVRHAVLQLIEQLLDLLDKEEIEKNKLQDFVTRGLYDNVWWIRKTAAECIAKLSQKHGMKWASGFLLKEIEKMHTNPKYSIRVHLAQLVTRLLDVLDPEFVRLHILKFVEILAEDKIANVRLNTARCLQKIRMEYGKSNFQLANRAFSLLQKLEKDEDTDVKFAAELAILDVNEWPLPSLPPLTFPLI